MDLCKYAQALGRQGGLARSKKLSTAYKKKIASMGGKAKALSRHAARRIERNFHGWHAVKTLRVPQPVVSVLSTKGPLPIIYERENRLP